MGGALFFYVCCAVSVGVSAVPQSPADDSSAFDHRIEVKGLVDRIKTAAAVQSWTELHILSLRLSEVASDLKDYRGNVAAAAAAASPPPPVAPPRTSGTVALQRDPISLKLRNGTIVSTKKYSAKDLAFVIIDMWCAFSS
eukprot:SAG31_NODE_6452_length_2013_cov_1.231975_1_plen_140_part_00